MDTIQILIYDGFDELDAIAPFEVLAAAGLDVELVTLDRTRPIRTGHGLSIDPHGTLGASPDLLVVPGGSWASRGAQGAWAEMNRGLLPAAIAARHAAGSTVAGVCTGTMLLAATGLLRGRPAVTHRVAIAELREMGAEVKPDARVVDDGDVLSAGGVSAAIDLALHLVGRTLGADAAAAGARRIEYEPQGPVFVTTTSARRHTEDRVSESREPSLGP